MKIHLTIRIPSHQIFASLLCLKVQVNHDLFDALLKDR